MIAFLLAVQQAPPLPGALDRQELPERGCAAYLWSRGPEPALVAMVTADPASLRLSLGGKPIDLPRIAQTGGEAGLGLARHAEYRAGEVAATVELTLIQRPDLTDGALVSDATLTVDRPGTDSVVLPLGGLVGCRPAPGPANR